MTAGSEHGSAAAGGEMQGNNIKSSVAKTSSSEPLSVNLQLDMSDSFLQFVGLARAHYRDSTVYRDLDYRGRMKELKAAKDQHGEGNGRRRPAILPLHELQVGNRTFLEGKDGLKIFAKFCYLTKKIVCQLCRDSESKRIDIPWADITTMRACFNNERFETLTIEVKCSPKSYSADKPLRGMFHTWEECEDTEFRLSEARYIHLVIKKGTLEKSFGKLLYSDVRLLTLITSPKETHRFKRRNMYGGSMHIPTQQIGMFAPLLSTSAAVSPSIGGAMPGMMMMNSSYSGTGLTTEYGVNQVYDMQNMVQHSNQGNQNIPPICGMQNWRDSRAASATRVQFTTDN